MTNDAAATESGDASTSADGSLSYADIKLSGLYDLTAIPHHRTDLDPTIITEQIWKERTAAFKRNVSNISSWSTTDTTMR